MRGYQRLTNPDLVNVQTYSTVIYILELEDDREYGRWDYTTQHRIIWHKQRERLTVESFSGIIGEEPILEFHELTDTEQGYVLEALLRL